MHGDVPVVGSSCASSASTASADRVGRRRRASPSERADSTGRRRRPARASGCRRRAARGRPSWRLDVGLVERVDAEQATGDGGGGLPQQHLRAERAGDGEAPPRRRPHLGRSRTRRPTRASAPRRRRPARSRARRGSDDDGQHARAVLAGRLGDQLLGPVAEAGERRPGVVDRELVAPAGFGADSGAEPQAGVVGSSTARAGRIASASSSSAATSAPARPLGTSPNAVSAL